MATGGRNGIKASVWLEMRNNLLTALALVDAEIDKALLNPASQRAATRCKELFAERERVAAELEDFGLWVEPHPAVWRGHG